MKGRVLMNWIFGLGVVLYVLSGGLSFITICEYGISQKARDILVNVAFTLYITASVLIAINCIFPYWFN